MRAAMIVLVAACVVLGVIAARLVLKETELVRAAAVLRADALAADAIEAARDSTRLVALAGGSAGDSVRVWQRRIVQVRQRADSLDRAIGLERAARYRVEATVRELTTQVASRPGTAASDSVRRGEFVVDDPPYHVVASVTLPPAPSDGAMTVRVRLDTVMIEARVGCGAGGAGSVRPATLTLVGPSWVGVRVVRVEQDPRVCSPAGSTPATSAPWPAWVRSRFAATVGYGLTVGEGGRLEVRPVVAVGVRLGW